MIHTSILLLLPLLTQACCVKIIHQVSQKKVKSVTLLRIERVMCGHFYSLKNVPLTFSPLNSDFASLLNVNAYMIFSLVIF
jgi:hypothetical protein